MGDGPPTLSTCIRVAGGLSAVALYALGALGLVLAVPAMTVIVLTISKSLRQGQQESG